MDPLPDAYHFTTYQAATPVGFLKLRVGKKDPDLDRLLASFGESDWAYITAWNPGQRKLTPPENAARQRELLDLVGDLTVFPGRGTADLGNYEEESLLVLGLSLADARVLARTFGQWAILAGSLGRPAELVDCR